MFIQRRHEGEAHKLGLNWMITTNTLLSLTMVLPIWFMRPTKYMAFDQDYQYYGRRMRVISFRLRLRRWKHFKTVKKILWSCSIYTTAIGKQTLLDT